MAPYRARGRMDQMKEKEKQTAKLGAVELSAFCRQIAMMQKAGIAPADGLYLMAGDAEDAEKQILNEMAEDVELGTPLFEAFRRQGRYPAYVVNMTELGERTGKLDLVMEALAAYYDKEHQIAVSIQNALTYPAAMIFMMLVVLFVLMTKVMPVFESVFKQLGVELSPLAKSAMQVGGVLSGAAIAAELLLLITGGLVYLLTKRGVKIGWAEKLSSLVTRRSKVARLTAMRRFASVLSLSNQSGLDTDDGLAMAEGMVEHPLVAKLLGECREKTAGGMRFDQAMKETGLLTGLQLQLVQMAVRTGSLDSIMNQISNEFSDSADETIDRAISRLEPTLVAVLAVAVGLILLSVMLPLMGMMAAMG